MKQSRFMKFPKTEKETKIMIQLKKEQLAGLVVSSLIFAWGAQTWLVARLYQPDSPAMAPLERYVYKNKSANAIQPLSPELLQGTLFFGAPPVIPVKEKPVMVIPFKSSLVVWGVTNGTAVVGTDPNSNQQTWIVKPGETVAGERIIGLGSNYIIVKNGTGRGKVMMRD
jgi:hypothetical protein